jgi:hypothetical protein
MYQAVDVHRVVRRRSYDIWPVYGGEVVRNISSIHCCYGLNPPQGHSPVGTIRSIEK